MDVARRIRHVEKITGCTITFTVTGNKTQFLAKDEELNREFLSEEATPSRQIQVLDTLHSAIYRERGRKVYENQNGICWYCDKPMNGHYEVDHDVPRARGQRDDRIANLRACCAGCPYHRIKHGQGK